jgi:hypothetical protein
MKTLAIALPGLNHRFDSLLNIEPRSIAINLEDFEDPQCQSNK